MKIKNKVVGSVAAIAMAISVIMPAAAEDIGANVNLLPNVCSVTASTSNVSMGPFQFDGKNSYALAGNPTRNIGLSVTVPGPGDTCETSFSLLNDEMTNGSSSIDGSNLSIKPGRSGGPGFYPGSASSLGSASTWNLYSDTTHSVVRMETAPEDAAPGTYQGTIQIAIVAAD